MLPVAWPAGTAAFNPHIGVRRTLDSVNVVDVRTGQVVENRRIQISGGMKGSIQAAGTRSGPEFERIDLEGAYILPGLFDMRMRGLPMHLRWKAELEQGLWLGSNLYTSTPEVVIACRPPLPVAGTRQVSRDREDPVHQDDASKIIIIVDISLNLKCAKVTVSRYSIV